MYTNVTLMDFQEAFRKIRPRDFSDDALISMYNYYVELEDERGQGIELDVIAMCGCWTEYFSLSDAYVDYEGVYGDYKDCEAWKENFEGHIIINDELGFCLVSED